MANDNSELIDGILNLLGDHPEEKLGALLGSLGGEEKEEQKDAGSNALSLLSGLGGGKGGGLDLAQLGSALGGLDLSKLGGAGGLDLSKLGGLGGLGDLGGLDIGMLLKLKTAFDKMNSQKDDRAVLLASLRPFMSKRRMPVYEKALKIVQLSKLAGLAKELDLFKELKLL